MKRREFLRKTSITAGICSIPAAAAASISHIKSAAEPTQDALKQRVTALEDKFTKLDASHKKTVRALVVLTGLSIGLDLSLLA